MGLSLSWAAWWSLSFARIEHQENNGPTHQDWQQPQPQPKMRLSEEQHDKSWARKQKGTCRASPANQRGSEEKGQDCRARRNAEYGGSSLDGSPQDPRAHVENGRDGGQDQPPLHELR